MIKNHHFAITPISIKLFIFLLIVDIYLQYDHLSKDKL